MMTYGDSVTLLLTFFVLMMTFVGPEDMDVQLLARGFREGGGLAGVFGKSSARANPGGDQKRLVSGRLSEEGAEKPPMYEDQVIGELRKYYPELDIAALKEFQGARLFRAPLSTLFPRQDGLGPRGRKILDRIAKMAKARTYRIIVRVRAGWGRTREEEKGFLAIWCGWHSRCWVV